MIEIIRVKRKLKADNDNRQGQSADYESKPGDPRRSGKAQPAGRRRELVAFVDSGGRVEARVGAVAVAEIRINPNGGKHAFFWCCTLPMIDGRPAPAADLDKAKSAIRHRVAQWCEAAGLVTRREP